jgi:hypothetical protein
VRDGLQAIVDVLADILRSRLVRLSVRRRRAAAANAIMLVLSGLSRAERSLVVLDVVREVFPDESAGDRKHH